MSPPTVDELCQRFVDFHKQLAADEVTPFSLDNCREEFDRQWAIVSKDPKRKQEWIDLYTSGYRHAKEQIARSLDDTLPQSMYPKTKS